MMSLNYDRRVQNQLVYYFLERANLKRDFNISERDGVEEDFISLTLDPTTIISIYMLLNFVALVRLKQRGLNSRLVALAMTISTFLKTRPMAMLILTLYGIGVNIQIILIFNSSNQDASLLKIQLLQLYPYFIPSTFLECLGERGLVSLKRSRERNREHMV